MSRQNAVIPVQFANAPPPPASEPTVNLDTDYNYLLGLIQDSSNGFVNSAADTGTANSYVVTLPSTIAPSGYTNGMTVAFLVANTNTGASTVNVNSLGSVPILTTTGNALSQGYLVQSNVVVLVYYNGNFYLITTPPSLVLNQDLGVTSSSATINCSGYNQVNVSVSYNGSGAFTLTLNNLGIGTIVNWVGRISAASARQILMVATTAPLGTPVSPIFGYGFYVPGTGYSQQTDLLNGANNLFQSGNHFVFNAVVQTLSGSSNPVMFGLIAGG